MDALDTYASDDDDDKGNAEAPPPAPVVAAAAQRVPLNAAPAVSLTAGRGSDAMVLHQGIYNNGAAPQQQKQPGGDLVLHNNPKKDVLYQPVQGPQDPSKTAKKNSSNIQANVAVDEFTFAEQRANFQRTGRAAAPHGAAVVTRTTLGYSRDRLATWAAQEKEMQNKRPRLDETKKDARLLVQGSDDEAEYGVWGPPGAEEQWAAENAVTDVQKGVALAPEQLAERSYLEERDRQRGIIKDKNDEESAQDRLVERKMAHLLPPRISGDSDGPAPATTQFHGAEEFDYKGQPWTAAPAGLGAVRADGGTTAHRCHVPKQCVHRLPGAPTKGVHRIRLSPVTGHLLLAAGLDGECKVWSVGSGTTEAPPKLMRTYAGHTAAVRDVQFNHDGAKFVSASFDRYLRLWDTASGEVLQTFSNRKVPYVVQFYPHDDNFFVVGCSDNKIVTYDATTAEITQEYNHHLGPVNAILFVEDNGTKMVTSSDDKKILVWEWDIGVPIKYISDPSMHSMPCLVMHPSQRFFVGQSLDNTIAVFQAGQKFALQKKKTFGGHIVSGYACEMAFSPGEGQFLVSGDGNGNLFFWDWKRGKILQKYRAHSQGPAICCAWHPLEPSVVFSCGWDGTIKMWK